MMHKGMWKLGEHGGHIQQGDTNLGCQAHGELETWWAWSLRTWWGREIGVGERGTRWAHPAGGHGDLGRQGHGDQGCEGQGEAVDRGTWRPGRCWECPAGGHGER